MILKETEIRPDHLMKGQAERFAADIRRLLRHKNEFVHVPCPACGSDQSHKMFEKYEMSYVICDNCGTMYINPRPTPSILEYYYTTSEHYQYWNNYIFPQSENARREKIFRPRAQRIVDICKKYGIEHGTLLEVGAGFGTFCEEIKRLGIFQRVIAVEPTPDLAETCRKRGLEVIEKPIEQVQFEKESIDIVVIFEVIEHLFCPEEFIKNCAENLRSGGLLVITCPNVRGFDIMVLQEHSDSVDVEHLNYFNPDSLSFLVQKLGFEIIEISTPGQLDAELVRKKMLNGKIDASSHPFLKQILIDEWERVGEKFQHFLAENLLSVHMWTVAQKKRKQKLLSIM